MFQYESFDFLRKSAEFNSAVDTQLLGHVNTEMVYKVYVAYLDQNYKTFDRTIDIYKWLGVGFNFFVSFKKSMKVLKIGVGGGRGEIRTLGTVASTSP